MRLGQPNEKLAEVVGATPLPARNSLQALGYIKKNKLQDLKAKIRITAGEALLVVFNGKWSACSK
jgi:hypothetical protein